MLIQSSLTALRAVWPMTACALFLVSSVAWATDHTTYVVSIPGADREMLTQVEAVGGVVDQADGRSARVYVHIAHWNDFLALGVPYTIEEIQPNSDKQLTGYPTYAGLTAILNDAATNYPEILRLESLGQSVQGRELWAVRVSDNPGLQEDEPEFAYISTMHGDEKIGTILCLNFLELLLEGYGRDPLITSYVDETEIWIVPLMNPDGYELNIRFNANNRDLNRVFPEFSRDFSGTIFTEGVPSTVGREPEVAHIMNWTANNSFVLGANYHAGDLLINYPYDEEPGIPSGSDAPTPDDELMREISLAYASLNPPMSASREFPDGISNGSAWYSISGGMQDWHYRYAGFIELTFEVSRVKTPGASALPGLWDDNRDAMFAYLERVHRGVRGTVTDVSTGEPLYAQVFIDSNPQPVFTDPEVGDYYRLLLPGNYVVRAEAPGLIPYTTETISVTTDQATRLDIRLSRGDVNHDGEVNAADLNWSSVRF